KSPRQRRVFSFHPLARNRVILAWRSASDQIRGHSGYRRRNSENIFQIVFVDILPDIMTVGLNGGIPGIICPDHFDTCTFQPKRHTPCPAKQLNRPQSEYPTPHILTDISVTSEISGSHLAYALFHTKT